MGTNTRRRTLGAAPDEAPPPPPTAVPQPRVDATPRIRDLGSIYDANRRVRDGDKIDLDTSALAPNPFNSRRATGDLSDLDSITTLGVLEPLIVTTREHFLDEFPEANPDADPEERDDSRLLEEGTHVILAGWRRWSRASAEGIATVPVIVRLTLGRREIRQISITENVGRTALDVLDEAQAYADYMADFGVGQNQAAKELGVPASRLKKRLALLNLPDVAKQAVRDGAIGPEDAYELRAAGERILEAAQLVKAHGYSPASAVQTVNDDHATPPAKAQPKSTAAKPTTTTGNPSQALTVAAEVLAGLDEGQADAPAPLSAADRVVARRIACQEALNRMPVKETAAALARLVSSGRRIEAQGEAYSLAGEWLGFDPKRPTTIDKEVRAGAALVLAVAELRLEAKEDSWDTEDLRHIDRLLRHGAYRPSAEERAALTEGGS
jgi:ParB-like chromosome segregation protein Spo0J